MLFDNEITYCLIVAIRDNSDNHRNTKLEPMRTRTSVSAKEILGMYNVASYAIS